MNGEAGASLESKVLRAEALTERLCLPRRRRGLHAPQAIARRLTVLALGVETRAGFWVPNGVHALVLTGMGTAVCAPDSPLVARMIEVTFSMSREDPPVQGAEGWGGRVRSVPGLTADFRKPDITPCGLCAAVRNSFNRLSRDPREATSDTTNELLII